MASGVRGWRARDRPARDYNATTNPGKSPRSAASHGSISAGQSHYRRTPVGTGSDWIALIIPGSLVRSQPAPPLQTHGCDCRCSDPGDP